MTHSTRDRQIIKAVGVIMLERIKALNMMIPETMLPEVYEQALEEYKTMLQAYDTSFEGTPELKQAVLDDVRYFLEAKGYLR